MVRSILFLIAFTLSAGAQSFTFQDIAFLSGAATTTNACTTGTNNVQWNPTQSAVTWTDLAGGPHNGEDQSTFNTNPVCNVLSFHLNDVILTLTGLGSLTNLRSLQTIAGDGSTIGSFVATNLYVLTNYDCYFHTNVSVIDVSGSTNLRFANWSQNAKLTSVTGALDGTNWYNTAINDCELTRPFMSNFVWGATNILVTSGKYLEAAPCWTIDMGNNLTFAAKETRDAAVTANVIYNASITVQDPETPDLNSNDNALTNADWRIEALSAFGRINTNATTVYVEYSTNATDFMALRSLAFPGYNSVENEGDLSAYGNPVQLRARLVDSDVSDIITTGYQEYIDPPP